MWHVQFSPPYLALLTNQVVCSYNDTTHKEQRSCYSVVTAENHVVNNSSVQEIPDFDEAGNGRYHSKNSHFSDDFKIALK